MSDDLHFLPGKSLRNDILRLDTAANISSPTSPASTCSDDPTVPPSSPVFPSASTFPRQLSAAFRCSPALVTFPGANLYVREISSSAYAPVRWAWKRLSWIICAYCVLVSGVWVPERRGRRWGGVSGC